MEGDDVARTSGLHRAMQRPAPKARRPHGDQSAAAGWRFAPTAMSGQETAAMAAVGAVRGGGNMGGNVGGVRLNVGHRTATRTATVGRRTATAPFCGSRVSLPLRLALAKPPS